jgi:glutamine synthetase
MNPYLALQAASSPPGIKGIEDKLELAPPTSGDIYEQTRKPSNSRTPAGMRRNLRGSKMLREAMGDAVIDHYARAAPNGSRKNSTRR